MRSLSLIVLASLGLVFLAGCAAKPSVSGQPLTLNGEVVYRERIALPPSAVALVTLLETLPGQSPREVSTLRVETAGRSIPIPFSLSLDGQLPPNAAYALTASIEVGGEAWFRTARPVPVSLQRPASALPAGAVEAEGQSASHPRLVLLTHRVMPQQEQGAGAATDRLTRFPRVLEGVTEAPAAKLTLLLQEEHVFTLRQEPSAGKMTERTGRWHQLRDGSIQLASPGAALLTLTPAEEGGMNLHGLPATSSKQTATTLRLAPPAPGAPAVALWPQSRRVSGQYRYLADAATFRDCATQSTYAVDGGSEAAHLQSLYLSKSRLPGEPLLARIDATLVEPRPADLEGTLPFIRVDRVASLGAETCAPLDATPPALLLGEGRWDLLEAFGEPAHTVDARALAHLTFTPSAPDRGAVSGSDGCNRFRGSYHIQNERLNFSQMASTLMLCQELGEQPMRFHRALNEADGWRAMGKVLELTRNGKVIAVFEKIEGKTE